MRAVVLDPNGSPRLEIVNSATGAASNFTLTDDADPSTPIADSHTASAAAGTGTAAQDAALTVDGVAMTSATNTITVMSGVTLTIPSGISASDSSTAQRSTISVTDDGSSRANAVKVFVSQINSLLSTISTQTAYGKISAGSTSSGSGTSVTGGGILAGNPDLRDFATQLSATIFGTATGDNGIPISLANMGLSIDQDGQLTFDTSAFQKAYASDPAGVQAAFTGPDGFISRVKSVAYNASAATNSNALGSDGKPVLGTSITGSLTAAINTMNDQINQYNDDIAAWDDRLAQKQASLQQIYTNLETSLASLQSQSSWLSNALSSLDGGWAQNK
jgi:flagellar hook-associated protein 2